MLPPDKGTRIIKDAPAVRMATLVPFLTETVHRTTGIIGPQCTHARTGRPDVRHSLSLSRGQIMAHSRFKVARGRLPRILGGDWIAMVCACNYKSSIPSLIVRHVTGAHMRRSNTNTNTTKKKRNQTFANAFLLMSVLAEQTHTRFVDAAAAEGDNVVDVVACSRACAVVFLVCAI